MSNLSSLFGGLNGFNTDLYLSTLATTFGFPREKLQLWNDGLLVDAVNEIRVFDAGGTGGIPYYAPLATLTNPVPMGASPIGDPNWAQYTAGGIFDGEAEYIRYTTTIVGETLFRLPAGASILAENTQLYVGSIRQLPNTDFTIFIDASGNYVKLTSVDTPVNTNVDIYSFFTLNDGEYSFAAPVQLSYVGDGATSRYELSASNLDTTGIFITLNGVQQAPFRDFTYGGNFVDFSEAPANGVHIDMKAFAPYVVGTPLPSQPVAPIIDQHVGDGTTTAFVLNGKPAGTSSTIDVFVNGIAQSSVTDFSYDASTGILTFKSSPPPASSIIDVKAYAVSIIDISSSYVVSSGSTQARTLGDRFSDVVNVKDFGAVGDGVGDDTLAIQAAMTAGFGSDYVVIDLSQGVYLVDNLTVPNNAKIQNGTIVFSNNLESSYEFPLLTAENFIRGTHDQTNYPPTPAENITFDHVVFRNQNIDTRRRIMTFFLNFDNITFNKCRWEQINGTALICLGDGIPLPSYSGPYDIPVPDDYGTNLRVTNCDFVDSFYVDTGANFQPGSGLQMVAVNKALVSGNTSLNVGAAYLMDYLNYDFNIVNNRAEITDSRFDGEVDVLGIYCGQATQRGTVSGNVLKGHTEYAIYLEASSYINVSANHCIGTGGTSTGIISSPNKLTPGQSYLAMVEIIIDGNIVTGFETGIALGSTLYEDSSQMTVTNNRVQNDATSIQPAIVIIEHITSKVSGNICSNGIQLSGAKDLVLSDNVASDTGYALTVQDDTYNQVSGSGNTFKTTGAWTCYANGVVGGTIRLDGGVIQSGSSGVVDGNGTIEFVGYSNSGPKVSVQSVALSVAKGDVQVGYLTVAGVTNGDQITIAARSETENVVVDGYVNNTNTVHYKAANNGTAIGATIDFDVYVEKYSSNIYRT